MSGEATKMGECRWCSAAYPTLADMACLHRNDPRIGDLAREFALHAQGGEPSDEQVGWFVEDAEAVIDDWPDATEWSITNWSHNLDDLPGIILTFDLNGVPYVLQEGEKETSSPVKRSEYLSWLDEADDGTTP